MNQGAGEVDTTAGTGCFTWGLHGVSQRVGVAPSRGTVDAPWQTLIRLERLLVEVAPLAAPGDRRGRNGRRDANGKAIMFRTYGQVERIDCSGNYWGWECDLSDSRQATNLASRGEGRFSVFRPQEWMPTGKPQHLVRFDRLLYRYEDRWRKTANQSRVGARGQAMCLSLVGEETKNMEGRKRDGSAPVRHNICAITLPGKVTAILAEKFHGGANRRPDSRT